MKVAIIGNMNNIGFSIMRYFRDLGVDAHLLLYTNDGVGPSAHFAAENDTCNWKKWEVFIHQTDIANFPTSALEWPADVFLTWVHSLFRRVRNEFFPTPSIRKAKICSWLAPYDLYIGCGIAPALFARVDKVLDIFYPYAVGIEWLGDPSFRAKYKLFGPLFGEIQRKQRKGIQAARYVINSDTSLAKNVFDEIGVCPLHMAIPMVYNGEVAQGDALAGISRKLNSWLYSCDFKLFCSARLIWTKKSSLTSGGSKNNHWLFHAIRKVKEKRPALRIGIAIAEYGPDIAATRKLINEQGLDENVFWFPKTGRVQLFHLLRHCDVAVGEFYSVTNMMWGGTGWEALAAGRPLLQGFLFNEGGFQKLFDMPPPPMLPVRTEKDILSHLLDMIDHPEKRKAIGEGAKEWFDRYNGIGLAKKWMDLLLDGETA